MSRLLALVLALCAPAHAQVWPAAGPVSIVVANSAGSSPDIMCRVMAEWLTRALGQQFIVVNRPGGNAIPATLAVTRAKPDGYTLYMAGNSAVTRNQYLLKSVPYDPERELTPVAMIIDSAPLVLLVHPSVPATNVAEFLAFAKANPRRIMYSASGQLSPIVGELISRRAGVQLVQVRYKETPLSINDAVSGVVNMTLQALTSIEPLVKSGKLRMLAVIARERFPVIPDVPAFSETVPGIDLDGIFYMMGPAGLPQAIVTRLNQEIDRFQKDDEVRRRMQAYGFAARGARTPEYVRDFIRAESESFGKIARELGLVAQ
jgi:tripartite-type tricarboxylate transporter receptor subunit TctC